MLSQPSLYVTGEILLGILVGVAAVYDIRYRRIPNWLVLAGMIAPWLTTVPGPGNCFWVFLLTAILGGAIALVVIMIHKRTGHTFFNVGWIVRDLLRFKAPYKSSEELDVTTDKGLRVPHAAMMAVGAGAFILIAQYGVVI